MIYDDLLHELSFDKMEKKFVFVKNESRIDLWFLPLFYDIFIFLCSLYRLILNNTRNICRFVGRILDMCAAVLFFSGTKKANHETAQQKMALYN